MPGDYFKKTQASLDLKKVRNTDELDEVVEHRKSPLLMRRGFVWPLLALYFGFNPHGNNGG